MADRLTRVFLQRGPLVLRRGAGDLRPIVEHLAKAREEETLDEEGDRTLAQLENALHAMDNALTDLDA